MKVVVFSAQKFETPHLVEACKGKHEVILVQAPLNLTTASLAKGAQAVSLFVCDDASAPVLEQLSQIGVKAIALRSAGYNHVDLEKARELGIRVARVPAYSPYAIAEHAVALMLALNRKLIRANSRVHELNFSLDGLTGFDMHGKTVGIIGTGKIGAVVARILHGFGCRVLAYDLFPDAKLAGKLDLEYTELDTLFRESDIITLHVPLTPETRYLINRETIAKMRKGVMLINTSRGGLVHTKDVIDALKTGQIGYLGLDVYEEENGLFFQDRSEDILQDDVISRLLTFKNVLITSHQGFLTETALMNIAETTRQNLDCFQTGQANENEL